MTVSKEMILLNAIFPIAVLLACGRFLRAFRIVDDAFLATSDKLVYYFFFPAMLFWKIGGAAGGQETQQLSLCLAAVLAVLAVFLISLLAIRLFGIGPFQAGTFSQACYRFNSYIGMALVMTILGDDGVRSFGLLIGFVIPLINVLSVSTLIWFSSEKKGTAETLTSLFKALILNPLILACAAGVAFSQSNLVFLPFVDNTLSLMTAAAMPLALVSIGGSLKFSEFRSHTRWSLMAALIKILVLPVVGFVLLNRFSVSGAQFTVGMIFFSLPTSTAIYILSSQMNSDTRLASAAIVISTLLSFLPLSIVILI